MTTLEERVRVVLNSKSQQSDWHDLIELFRRDPEAFYLIALDVVSENADVRRLAQLAQRVQAAVRDTYSIKALASGDSVVATGNDQITAIPPDCVSQVSDFLRAIDGKLTVNVAGKDYLGREISEAELQFKLGDRSEWANDRERLRAERSKEPLVLHVDPSDLENLSFQPAYVTFGLLNCARKTVLAPTFVFKGLQRGAGACEDVQDGWAFCGKPRHTFGNDGRPIPAPAGMVYVVFADKEGFVFDWDWVQENPEEPGCPINRELRFGNPYELNHRDAVLDLAGDLVPGEFDPTKACYSERGDCIFCYISDHLAFAERINSDLTVFRQLDSKAITGFKVKNVMRIMQEDNSVVMDDAPDLIVSVRRALVSALKGHKDTESKVYELIIEALWNPTALSQVRLPKNRMPRISPANI